MSVGNLFRPHASLGLGVVAGLLALVSPLGSMTHACSHPPGKDVYELRHELAGEIGQQTVTYSCEGEDLVIETEIEGEATMFSVPIYQMSGNYREVWRGDRLISFDSRVNDNGELFEVKARAEGEHTVIDRRRGTIEAPGTIISDLPWNHEVIDRKLLFDARRGKLRHVEIEPAGKDTLTIGGRKVPAQKYIMTGDLERVLWYGEDGSWLQSQLPYRGSKVFVTRRS